MQINSILVMLISIVLVVTIAGCEKEFSSPVALQSVLYPAVPANLTAQIGDKYVHIAWDAPLTPAISHYFIYRKDTLITKFELLDSAYSTDYKDTDVINSMLYAYRVTAVDSNGYEGPYSREVVAKPGINSLNIEHGVKYTNSHEVTLTLVASQQIEFMQIYDDSIFAEAVWEPFTVERPWTLPEGDGLKWVYARFRDASGNQTYGPVFDSIILDTYAEIMSLAENSNGEWMTAGDTLTFTLVANESYGIATIDMGTEIQDLALYDSGTRGDEIANDGIYSLDFIIPGGIDVQGAAIIGHFQDHLGNNAAPFTAQTTITIYNPPTPVTLFTPELVGSAYNALNLSWTQNSDNDFYSYKVFRADTASVDSASELINILHAQSTTTMVDENLLENTSYFYRVYVYDDHELSRGSNVVEGRTGSSSPPEAVSLDLPLAIDEHTLSLSWAQSNEADFSSYRLFRSTTPNISGQGSPIQMISERGVTYFQDGDLSSSSSYYYRLYVYDTQGQSAGSNIVSGTTLDNSPPKAVQLASPTVILNGLRLTWSMNRDEDFDSYRIFRSTSVNVDTTAAPVIIINTQQTTTFDDIGLEADTQYHYRIFVYDSEGLSAGSNKVAGITLP